MMTVAGDGRKHFFIDVVAQVCERWEVSRYKTTTVTSADERCKSLAVGCTSEAPPGAEAYISLAMTTERKIVCIEMSSMPWARKTLRAYREFSARSS